MRQFNTRTQYYVEGKCEKKLVKTLIEQNLIIPGQTDVLNPVQERIQLTHLRKFPQKTTIVLIFDTDTSDTDILKSNIQFLSSQPNINRVILIPQVPNLEGELIRCSDVRQIRSLINCRSNSEFKAAFIEEKHLFEKLLLHGFDFGQLWSTTPDQHFLKAGVQNSSDLIRKKEK